MAGSDPAGPDEQRAATCPQSERVDGPWHSYRFDGDDPYEICVYCGEVRDALSGRLISPGSGPTPPRPELFEGEPVTRPRKAGWDVLRAEHSPVCRWPHDVNEPGHCVGECWMTCDADGEDWPCPTHRLLAERDDLLAELHRAAAAELSREGQGMRLDGPRPRCCTASRLLGPQSRRIGLLSITLWRLADTIEAEWSMPNPPSREAIARARRVLADNTVVVEPRVDPDRLDRAALAMHRALYSGMTAGVTAWNAVGTRGEYLAAVRAVAAELGVPVPDDESEDRDA